MDDDEIPDRWYALAQRQLEILQGKARLIEDATELQVLAGKRGSRRWSPPAVTSPVTI